MALLLKPFQLMALLKPLLIGIDGVCRRVLQCCLVTFLQLQTRSIN